MDPYMQPRRAFSGGLGNPQFDLDAAAVTQTLVEAYTDKPAEVPRYHSIHIQRLKVDVKTGAAVTWTFRFVAPGAEPITSALDMSVAGVQYAFDFGSQGMAGAAGRDFEVVMSGAGAAAIVSLEGFQEMLNDII